MAFVIGGTLRITSASKDLIFFPYVRSAPAAYFRCSKWPALKTCSGSCCHRNKCSFGIVALTECAAQRNSFVLQLLLSREKNKSVWSYPGRKPNSHARTFLSVITNTLSKNRKLFILYFFSAPQETLHLLCCFRLCGLKFSLEVRQCILG